MTTQRQREIVIEFEKVRTIRKRAVTTLAHCNECGGEADFVALQTAAELFDTAHGDLAAFVAANAVHHDTDIDICIPSLLAVMHERANGNGVRQIGGSVLKNDNADHENGGSVLKNGDADHENGGSVLKNGDADHENGGSVLKNGDADHENEKLGDAI